MCQVAAFPDDFMEKFDDDNCWDFSAGCGSADDDDHQRLASPNTSRRTCPGITCILKDVRVGPPRGWSTSSLRYLSQSMMRKDSPEFKLFASCRALALKEQGHLAKWGKKHRRPRSCSRRSWLGDDCVVVALDARGGGDRSPEAHREPARRAEAALAEAALVMVRLRTRPRARRRRTRRRQIPASLEAEEHRPGTTKKSRKGKKVPVPAPAPAPAPASAGEASSSSSSEDDDDDDDLLLLAKQQASRSAPAPRARARTKAALAAAPRAREANPAMASRARSAAGSFQGGRIVGTDLAQFYKSLGGTWP